jgi:hypothetical protein
MAEETARDARESKAAKEVDGFMTRYADRVFLVDLGSFIENIQYSTARLGAAKAKGAWREHSGTSSSVCSTVKSSRQN